MSSCRHELTRWSTWTGSSTHSSSAAAPPAKFRAEARAEIAALPTATLIDDTVTEVAPTEAGFAATTATGQQVYARRVVLATGMRDVLPEIPGLADLFGRLVHHCPFCHGHELAGQRVGVIADEKAAHLPHLLAPIAGAVDLLHGVRSVAEVDGRVQVTFVDGDGAHHRDLPMPQSSVLAAAAAGQTAGGACAGSLLTDY